MFFFFNKMSVFVYRKTYSRRLKFHVTRFRLKSVFSRKTIVHKKKKTKTCIIVKPQCFPSFTSLKLSRLQSYSIQYNNSWVTYIKMFISSNVTIVTNITYVLLFSVSDYLDRCISTVRSKRRILCYQEEKKPFLFRSHIILNNIVHIDVCINISYWVTEIGRKINKRAHFSIRETTFYV